MTPEERITKIENLLHALVEKQVQFEIEHEKIQTQQRETANQLQELTRSVGRVSAAQEVTEIRLQTLIEHVDRHERRLNDLESRNQ